MQRQLAAQQLVIQNGWGANPDEDNDVLLTIDRTTIEMDHHEFESMTDEQWAEFRDSWHSNRIRGRLMDTLHNLEETILEGIVDRIEIEADDEDDEYERIIHENIAVQARMDLVINNNDEPMPPAIPQPTYQIFVMTLTGQTITLEVLPTDTLVEIKAQIAVRLNFIFMQPSDYYLSFQSRRLENGRILICIYCICFMFLICYF